MIQVCSDINMELSRHVETVVELSNINPRPRTYIEIGVDTEEYYKLKNG